MAEIGRFGVERPEEEALTFAYFDDTIRVNPEFGVLDIADFMEFAVNVDERDPSAFAEVKRFIRASVHAEDFDTFWSAAKQHRQRFEDLQEVILGIIEAVSDRPTAEPSDSSDGQSTTSRSSAGGSSSEVIARLEAQGRPSVALMVRQADQGRASLRSA